MTYELWIPRFRCTRLNVLMRMHHLAAYRQKKADMQVIAHYWRESGLPAAKGKRRVSVLIRLKPRAKKTDDDAMLKVMWDALARCGAITDDNRAGVEMGRIDYERGTETDWGTLIVLEDLE